HHPFQSYLLWTCFLLIHIHRGRAQGRRAPSLRSAKGTRWSPGGVRESVLLAQPSGAQGTLLKQTPDLRGFEQVLDRLNVRSLTTFGAVGDFKTNLLVFLQRF